MVSFGTAVRLGIKKALDFSGRATRAEYWWWALFAFLSNIGVLIFGSIIDETFAIVLYILYNLALFVPSLSLLVRRLHDGGHSALWLLWCLLPYIGGLVVFVATLQESKPDNEYGPNPLTAEEEEVESKPSTATPPTPAATTPLATTSEEDAKELCAKGTELYKEANYAEAATCFEKAASQGNAKAQCSLGTCYLKGQGVGKDLNKAIELYKLSAKKNNKLALYNLGQCYEKGLGVEKDESYARNYYEKAAALGHTGAQSKLEKM